MEKKFNLIAGIFIILFFFNDFNYYLNDENTAWHLGVRKRLYPPHYPLPG